MREPSEDYLRALRESQEHHASSKTFSGKFLRPHGPVIKDLIKKHGVKSILDYGAGKGEQYSWVNPETGKTLEEDWGVKVARYDPAWPPYAAEPIGKFDMVICTHTLGSIPIKDLSWVIAKIYGLTKKVVFFAEKLGPVRKTLLSRPDLHPIGWKASDWIEVLNAGRPERIVAWLSCRYRTESEGVIVRRFLLGSGNYEDADRAP